MRHTIIIVSLCFTLIAISDAWGDVGHRIVAALAERNLTSLTRQQVTTILPENASLCSVATWADHVKYQKQWIWSRALHYADTAAWKCGFDTAQDCTNNKCIVTAVANYTDRLQTPISTHANNRTVDLMFLVHFVGDLAQPLHVGFKTDKGGNEIHGSFCGHKTNLHAIWDENILERRLKQDFHDSEQHYIDYLWTNGHPDHDPCSQTEALSDCIQRWASSSASLACTYAYVDADHHPITTGFDFCDRYYNSSMEIIERQLVVAGHRLAWLLNQILHFQMPVYAEIE